MAINGAELPRLVEQLSRVGRVCSLEDIAMSCNIAAAVDVLLRQEVQELLACPFNEAVLVCYQCDGWATEVGARASEADGSCKVLRAGKSRVEFLLQHIYIRIRRTHGPDACSMIVGSPMQLNRGKTSWNGFSACCEFFDLIKPGDAHAIVMTLYVMDGLIHTANKRMFRVRHELAHHPDHAAEAEGEVDLIDQLCDWNLHMRCKSHAAQLAVFGALKPFSSEEDVSRDAHNCIRCLRSNSDDLMSHLDAMMVQCVRFTERSHDGSDVACFWKSRGVRDEMLGLFCKVDPVFSDGCLHVGLELATEQDSGRWLKRHVLVVWLLRVC